MAMTKEEIRRIYGESDPKKMGFFTKIKMLFLHPKQFFEGVKGEKLGPAFVMFLVFFLINIGVQSFVSPSTTFVAVLLLTAVVGVLVLLAFYFWIHMIVKLFGGKASFKQTLKALFYAGIPPAVVQLILGLIIVAISGTLTGFRNLAFFSPLSLFSLVSFSLVSFSIFVLIGIASFIWELYLAGLGVSRMHGISTLRGVLAYLVALLSIAATLFLLFFVIYPPIIIYY